MVDDQILKAAGALIAAVDQQLSLLDAEIAAMQRRLAELEVIIVAPAPLSIAEVFFVEAMLTPTLRAAEAKAAELPLIAVEPDAVEVDDDAVEVENETRVEEDEEDDARIEFETRPVENSDFERKLLVAYE